jgi:DivIVA domain-containing protein
MSGTSSDLSLGIGHTPAVAGRESSKADERTRPSTRAPGLEPEHGFRDLRQYVPADILDASFPLSVRGYERHAVDDHLKRVNRVIAELKVSASPQAAVRHALDVAGEKVEGLLQAARDAAEEITASATQEAEESTARVKADAAQLVVNASTEADRMRTEAEELIAEAAAKAEETVAKARAEANEILSEAKAGVETSLRRSHAQAADRLRHLEEELAAMRERAETRMREIEKDTEKIRKRRSELLDDIRARASRLGELADTAAAAMPSSDATTPDAETQEPEAAEESDSPVATEEPSPPPRSGELIEATGKPHDQTTRATGAGPDS